MNITPEQYQALVDSEPKVLRELFGDTTKLVRDLMNNTLLEGQEASAIASMTRTLGASGYSQPLVGVATCWNADVIAQAKKDLQPGEILDGEGGYTVVGKLLPADRSRAIGGLPLGLAHDIKVIRPVKQGQCLSWDDVQVDGTTKAYALRREMEAR